jgi:hypothetical protein
MSYTVDKEGVIYWKVNHYDINNNYTHYTFKIIESIQPNWF